MELTPEDILRVKTKGTLNIIEGSPLHNAVISAMKYYAKQQVNNNSKTDVAKQKDKSIPLPPNECDMCGTLIDPRLKTCGGCGF